MSQIRRIQLRRGTAAEWTAVNPVLASGEVGVESDTNRAKLGDGSTQWDDLTYGFVTEQAAQDAMYYAEQARLAAANTSAVTGTVATEADLDPLGADGIIITADTSHGWVWTGSEWVDVGQIQGQASAGAGLLAERPAPGTLPEGFSYFAVDDAGGIASTVVDGEWVRHSFAVNELPELADSLSTAVDSSTPGLVAVNVVHHPFGQSFVNSSTTETTLNTSTPEIPGGTLDVASGLVDFEIAGEVNNTSGSPVTYTVRLKASQGGSTVSTWTIPVTLEANGVARYILSGSAAVADVFGVQKHLAGAARISASLTDLTPVVNGVVAPTTVNMNPSLPIAWSVTGQMTVAASGTNVYLHRGSVRHLATA